MIFSAFLFAVGISITFSLRARLGRSVSRTRSARHTALRSALLLIIGLGINGSPDYILHAIRIPGILQRIAPCYRRRPALAATMR